MQAVQPEELSTLSRRGLSSFGGYALRQRPCPADTSTCGTSHCCPTGYSCDQYYSFSTLCCPSGNEGCRDTVGVLPACANNDWGLYLADIGSTERFCCLSDAVGVGTSSGGYRCMNRTLPIPTSLEIGQATQATGSRTLQPSTVATGKSPSSTGSSSTGSNSGTDSSSNGASSNSGNSSRGSSLPTGAIVAIAVLTTLLVVLLIALAIGWVFYKKRQRKRAAQGEPIIGTQAEVKAKPSVLPISSEIPDPQAKELSGKSLNQSVQELTPVARVELDGTRRAEL